MSLLPLPMSSSTAYCRKQKSLGLLCSNFLGLYNRDGIDTVGLDDAASRLGVERRRIYDIVNVLESVGVLVRKAKNTYHWNGLGAIPKALEQLKEEGFRNNDGQIDVKSGNGKVSDDEEDEKISSHSASLPEKSDLDSMHKTPGLLKSGTIIDNRKEKSLGLLTKNFIKLFLCTNSDIHSLDDAAKTLLGDAHNPSLTRTKVRRLYDIANVLSSMNFIEKTHHPETRKPAFRWLGMTSQINSQPGPATAVFHQESKKRAFGTELTNICFKRNKLDNQEVKLFGGVQSQRQPIKPNANGSISYPGPDPFGHSGPASQPKSSDGESNKVNKTQDLENLASNFWPQYQNQALRDLFVHYMDAWKAWYSEVAEMDPIGVV